MSELSPVFISRSLDARIQEALLDTPAVLVNGPRQCGKTTLVRKYANADRPYFSLDEHNLLLAVKADPLGFVRQNPSAVIDEVQRAPELLLALKASIDNDRRPGRFLLTGSANLLALPQIADSLAGRMEVLTLLPLSNAEINGHANDFLQCAQTQNWPASPVAAERIGAGLVQHVLAGGYPEMRQRATPARRQAWAKAYLTTLVERDVQDVARIDDVTRLPQLLAMAAGLSGQLPNMSQLGGQIGLASRTVEKYLGVFEKMFLLRRLPAWSRHEINRLIKAPKLHFLDAGLQATLTRLTPELVAAQRHRWGATLETWVYAELLKHLSTDPQAWFLSYYRDKDQVEVDFVLESPLREVIGIEVKAAATVQLADFKGLIRLQNQCGADFVTGIVLFDGENCLPFGPGLWAVPLQYL
ncbi:MAG: AAA family ATPase [Comamonadaceae bacterium CG_4_9_14_0_8_um_filter_60_18]|nr:MAG: AAA family ATPase [Comamonadaceae bacterium CG17_big_fil_post_rev_8_21_14_2_50_60_13]PJC11649.1 MAG: AAA family ATPase [Comamonadaceae bacterium CG_4_9_14_0_8_um_filter_60_18]